jgi:hypothetical protein
MSLPRLNAANTGTDNYSNNRRTALQVGSSSSHSNEIEGSVDMDFGFGLGNNSSTASTNAPIVDRIPSDPRQFPLHRPAGSSSSSSASVVPHPPVAPPLNTSSISHSDDSAAGMTQQVLGQYKQILASHGTSNPSSSSSSLRSSIPTVDLLGPPGTNAPSAGIGASKQDQPAHMSTVRTLHSSVQATVGGIQAKTSLILQEQERDLLRSFKVRLNEVGNELERERKKNESGSVLWVARCKKLANELEWLKELTETLSTENKQLLTDNRRMARTNTTMENDRAFLIKQLVGVKKENARLRFLVEQQIKENQEIISTSNQLQLQQGGQLLQQQQPLQLMPGTSNSQTSAPPSRGGASSISVPPLRLPSNPSNTGSSVGLIPANMRTSLLAAATTEGAVPHGYNSGGILSGIQQNGASMAMNSMVQNAGLGGGSNTSRPATTSEYGRMGNINTNSGAQSARLASTQPLAGQQQPQAHPLLPESRLSTSQESRFKSVIASLKRRLEEQTSIARQSKIGFNNLIQQQTQLQHMFKSCLDAAREAASGRKTNNNTQLSGSNTSRIHTGSGGHSLSSPSVPLTSRPPLDPRTIPFSDLTNIDRANIVEWMLAQPAVMAILFDRIFPVNGVNNNNISSNSGVQYGGINNSNVFLPNGGYASPANALGMHYDYQQYIIPSKLQQQQMQQQQSVTSMNPEGYDQDDNDDDDYKNAHILVPTSSSQRSKSNPQKSYHRTGIDPVPVDYFAPDDEEESAAAVNTAAIAAAAADLGPPTTSSSSSIKPNRIATVGQVQQRMHANKQQQQEYKE